MTAYDRLFLAGSVKPPLCIRLIVLSTARNASRRVLLTPSARIDGRVLKFGAELHWVAQIELWLAGFLTHSCLSYRKKKAPT